MSTTTTTPATLILPSRAPLLTRTGWGAWLVALIVLCALVPVLNLVFQSEIKNIKQDELRPFLRNL